MRILLSEHQQGMKCSKTPPSKTKLVFPHRCCKTQALGRRESDMNGVFCDMLHICTWIVVVSEENDVNTLEKKKIDLVSKKSYHKVKNDQ